MNTSVKYGPLAPSVRVPHVGKRWVEASSPLGRDVIAPLSWRIRYMPRDEQVLYRHAALLSGRLP